MLIYSAPYWETLEASAEATGLYDGSHLFAGLIGFALKRAALPPRTRSSGTITTSLALFPHLHRLTWCNGLVTSPLTFSVVTLLESLVAGIHLTS